MNLSDFGVSDCPGGVCRVDVSKQKTADELEFEFITFCRRDAIRCRAEHAVANRSFWEQVGLPLARVMGVEFGLRQISPILAKWS